jgi:hypothetical protein
LKSKKQARVLLFHIFANYLLTTIVRVEIVITMLCKLQELKDNKTASLVLSNECNRLIASFNSHEIQII